jgi:hypothetical protein
MQIIHGAPLLLAALLVMTGCGGKVVVDGASENPPPTDLPPETPYPDLPDDASTQVWSTGGEVDTVTVPQGKSIAELLVWGGGGGCGAPGSGGGGAFVRVVFDVSAGDLLEVRVASGGEPFGGGGGASFVLRNGLPLLVAAGGGGGGVDGCGGCSEVKTGGMGGAGGPAGGDGQDGWKNDYAQTNSGGGGGARQNAGGLAGVNTDMSMYDECTTNGSPGLAQEGGVALSCGAGDVVPAKGHLGGGGIGNGSSGGGGAGFFGGGSGSAKWTYTGGGGGGGSSWIHASAKLIETNGGDGQTPGGQGAAGYQGDAGRGGDGITGYESPESPGRSGLIIMHL